MARSGDDAMGLAVERTYDLVLADARIVTAEGRGFTEALLAARPGWAGRLVTVSANGRSGTRAARHLRKPFNLRELKAVAEELLSIPPRSPATTA
jgi:DNA-binding response OmpR family regulator